jgi:hypothetical protein
MMTSGPRVSRRVVVLTEFVLSVVAGVAANASSRGGSADEERDLEAARRHAAIEEHYAQLQEQGGH